MLSAPRIRVPALVARCRPVMGQRFYGSPSTDPIPANEKPRPVQSPVSPTNAMKTTGLDSNVLQESPEEGEKLRQMQAPNRKGVWARSQNPREKAMSGPRFEQTIIAEQPRPLAAVELIHKQPVRWVKSRQVSCDGGGGPLGHPRIFINVDKPQINFCTYCGVPFASEHHRQHIEAHPELQTYPLDPVGDAAEVPESMSATGKPLEVR